MTVFIAKSAAHLAPAVRRAGHALGRFGTLRFPDGERGLRILSPVSGKTVTLLANVLPDPASLFELLALHWALLERDARVRLAVPYMAYARLDRLTPKGESATGAMVAGLLSCFAQDGLTALDPHSPAIATALGRKACIATALPLFAKELRRAGIGAVVAPDRGALPRARALARLLPGEPTVAVVGKTRLGPGKVVARTLVGDVRGRRALIVDDMIDTGGTIAAAARLVRAKGATDIRVAATHGIFTRPASAVLRSAGLSGILVTDSLPQKTVRGLRTVPCLASLISLTRPNRPAPLWRDPRP